MTTPAITVCVSTRNRATLLPRLVAHLEAQTLPFERFEVVLVDNGSTDGTWDQLLELASTSPLQLTVLRNPPGGGPAAGRNRAWRAAAGPFCAFTDDDCMPTPTWLENTLRAVRDRHVVAIGAVGPPPEELHTIGHFSRVVVSDKGTALWFATANLTFRRVDLENVDGFDETFLNVAGEDTDLALRVVALGARPVFVGDAVVHHSVEQTTLRQLLRDQARWADLVVLFARYPHMREQLLHRRYFWKSTHVRVLGLAVGTVLAPIAPALTAVTLAFWAHEHLCSLSVGETFADRCVRLPGALAIDVAEVAAMVHGSVRHRTLVL